MWLSSLREARLLGRGKRKGVISLPREGSMKTIRYVVVLAALLGLLGVYSFSINEKPFTLTVVDASGRAVPYVRVSSDDGIVCYANEQGDVTWPESSLMNRRV